MAAAALLGIDVESVVLVALEQDADPVAALAAAVASFEAARWALLSDEAIEGIRCDAESGELGSGWAAVAEAARRRLAWKARAEPAAREAGIADVEVVYAASLSRGEDPLAALESVTAARLERKKQAENAAGETGIIDIETEYGRARDVGEDPLSMLERATNMVVAARAALVTDETIQAQHAAAESRERGSGWRAVEKASQTRSAWKGRAEPAAREAGIADVEAVYAASLSRGEDPLAALEAATAARQAAARRRAAVEGREAAIRATRVGADWLLEAEQRVLRAADRRPTLEEREGIAETVERRIREHLDSRLEALAATVGGAELLEQMQADASAATLAAEERVIELAKQRLEEHLAEQEKLFVQPVGEDLFTAHLAARDPAWRPGGRTTAENRTAALRAAAAEGARLARARDVFDGRWSRRHYRSAAGALGGRFTLADVDAALKAAEGFAGRVAGLSGGTGLAVLTEAVAAGGELTVADLEAAVEGAEQAERQAARREALSAGGRELYAVRLAALAAADRRAGETPSGAVVDQALDETESDAVRLPRLDALFGDAELRSYYRGTLGSAGDQHQVPLAQLDAVLRATEAFRDRRNTVLQYPGGDQHPGGAALWAAEQRSLSPAVVAVAFDTALARVESRLENRVQQAADEFERLLRTRQPYSPRVPALGDERLEELGQLRLEPADAFVEATVAELRERYARRARYDTSDKLYYSPQDRLESERECGRVIYSGRANWADASTGSRRWKHEGERVGRTGISLALALERVGWKQRSARSKRWHDPQWHDPRLDSVPASPSEHSRVTPYEFITKWRASELKERSASQEHFIDLCRLLGEPTPVEADPTGERYCFERGARKDTGGDGWADVWKRHHFAWEYKGRRADLDAAFEQLRQYSLALENPRGQLHLSFRQRELPAALASASPRGLEPGHGVADLVACGSCGGPPPKSYGAALCGWTATTEKSARGETMGPGVTGLTLPPCGWALVYSPAPWAGRTVRSMVRRRWSTLPSATSTASRRASKRWWSSRMSARSSRKSVRRSSMRVFTPPMSAYMTPVSSTARPTPVPTMVRTRVRMSLMEGRVLRPGGLVNGSVQGNS